MLQEKLNKLWQSGNLPCSLLIAGEVESLQAAIASFIGKILPLSSSDVFMLEPKERSIGINQIRELNYWSNETAELYKFAVIKEADKMTFAAANACLKTLEEPAKGRFFFLIVSNPKALPKTLASRCQIIWHKSKEDEEEYAKLINAILTDNKESLVQFLMQPGSNIAPLIASWIKSKITSQSFKVNPSMLMEKTSRLQALARHYSSLALDARHVSAILLHELFRSS